MFSNKCKQETKNWEVVPPTANQSTETCGCDWSNAGRGQMKICVCVCVCVCDHEPQAFQTAGSHVTISPALNESVMPNLWQSFIWNVLKCKIKLNCWRRTAWGSVQVLGSSRLQVNQICQLASQAEDRWPKGYFRCFCQRSSIVFFQWNCRRSWFSMNLLNHVCNFSRLT